MRKAETEKQQLKKEPLKASEVFSESSSEEESDSAETSGSSESDDDIRAKYVHYLYCLVFNSKLGLQMSC